MLPASCCSLNADSVSSQLVAHPDALTRRVRRDVLGLAHAAARTLLECSVQLAIVRLLTRSVHRQGLCVYLIKSLVVDDGRAARDKGGAKYTQC